MRLIDQEPEWATSRGSAFHFLCPCGHGECLIVPLANPRDGGPPDPPEKWGPGITARWTASSYDFATMSITPSILAWEDKAKGVQHWHGWITNGEVTSC